MRSPRPYALVAVGLVLGLSGACASTPEQPAADGDAPAEVEVVNIAFAPAAITIDTGTEVVWTNQDESVHHTVTSGMPGDNGVPGVSKAKKARPDGAFDGDLPDASSDFAFRFDEAGTYGYFCKIHPSMTGEVIVE